MSFHITFLGFWSVYEPSDWLVSSLLLLIGHLGHSGHIVGPVPDILPHLQIQLRPQHLLQTQGTELSRLRLVSSHLGLSGVHQLSQQPPSLLSGLGSCLVIPWTVAVRIWSEFVKEMIRACHNWPVEKILAQPRLCHHQSPAPGLATQGLEQVVRVNLGQRVST